MSEETSATSVEGVTKLLEKHGLATFLLVAILYVGWTSFLSPAADKYMKLLDSVTESNKSLAATIVELKDGMVKIGEANTQIGRDNERLLEAIDRRLQDVEETSKEISRKLDDLRGGRGQSYGPASLPAFPANENIQSSAAD